MTASEVALQAADQVEDLRLNGHVEGGGRLVGDQHLRPAGERPCDHPRADAWPPESSCGYVLQPRCASAMRTAVRPEGAVTRAASLRANRMMRADRLDESAFRPHHRVQRGQSGSWEIIAISPPRNSAHAADSCSVVSSRPTSEI